MKGTARGSKTGWIGWGTCLIGDGNEEEDDDE